MEASTNKEDRGFVFLAFYCSFVWFVMRFSLPLASFQNAPLYLPLTLFSFRYLSAKEIFWTVRFLIFILAYEFLKMVQPGIGFSARAMFSAMAFGIIIPSLGFSLLKLLQYPEEKLIAWLKVTLYVFAASLVIEMFLHLSGVIQNYYAHYFLPIGRYSGTLPEPSAVSSTLAPFIFILVNYPKYFITKFKVSGIILLGFVVLLGLSSSLLAVILLACVASLVRRVVRFDFAG